MLVPEMAQCHQRMMPQHPWSAPTHHPTHLLPHLGAVAVYGTSAARWFPVSMGAVAEPGVGILLQSLTVAAGRIVSVVMTAIKPYHHADSSLFPPYSPGLSV